MVAPLSTATLSASTSVFLQDGLLAWEQGGSRLISSCWRMLINAQNALRYWYATDERLKEWPKLSARGAAHMPHSRKNRVSCRAGL